WRICGRWGGAGGLLAWRRWWRRKGLLAVAAVSLLAPGAAIFGSRFLGGEVGGLFSSGVGVFVEKSGRVEGARAGAARWW
ncbi:UNVERIFIED_CONTAM: hypothetical protein NY603_31235, partial [Bacteroidetes bacterium 56_B9]